MALKKPLLRFDAKLRKNNTVLIPDNIIENNEMQHNATVNFTINYFQNPKKEEE